MKKYLTITTLESTHLREKSVTHVHMLCLLTPNFLGHTWVWKSHCSQRCIPLSLVLQQGKWPPDWLCHNSNQTWGQLQTVQVYILWDNKKHININRLALLNLHSSPRTHITHTNRTSTVNKEQELYKLAWSSWSYLDFSQRSEYTSTKIGHSFGFLHPFSLHKLEPPNVSRNWRNTIIERAVRSTGQNRLLNDLRRSVPAPKDGLRLIGQTKKEEATT